MAAHISLVFIYCQHFLSVREINVLWQLVTSAANKLKAFDVIVM